MTDDPFAYLVSATRLRAEIVDHWRHLASQEHILARAKFGCRERNESLTRAHVRGPIHSRGSRSRIAHSLTLCTPTHTHNEIHTHTHDHWCMANYTTATIARLHGSAHVEKIELWDPEERRNAATVSRLLVLFV